MTYALIIAALLAIETPRMWAARHTIKAATRDVHELLDRGAAWPGKFRRGIAYHRNRFEHEKCHAKPRETTPVTAVVKARTA